jgi:dihydrolipoamide dehydrogenase
VGQPRRDGDAEVPRRLIALGGGTVGVEMAQAVKRLGADEVTVLEGLDRLLGREEPFAGEEVRAGLEADGVVVVTGAKVVAVDRPVAGGPVTVTVEDGRAFVGDEPLVAVGRRPSTGDLGLDSVRLTPGRAVDVDERLRATGVDGDWLYAVGDVNGRALLTHMGKYQARIAADVILGRTSRPGEPRRPRHLHGSAGRGCRPDRRRPASASRPRRTARATCPVAWPTTRAAPFLVVDADRRARRRHLHRAGGAGFVHGATIAVIGEVPWTTARRAVLPGGQRGWLHLLEYGL